MAEQSAISWTDSTFNPWIGCTKVANDPATGACVNCYAEREDGYRRWTQEGWGAGKPRKRTSPNNWAGVRMWQKRAGEFKALHGRRRRVFCSSLADVFDNEVEEAWRHDLWRLVKDTPELIWILLTKRIGNVPDMKPKEGLPDNVFLMATITTQSEWDRDIDKLLSIPAMGWGVSDEPTLARIDIDNGGDDLDWFITGGESGPYHRYLDMDIVRWQRDQCAARHVAYHHKQNGGVRGKDGGCLVDGVAHKAFPECFAR